MQFGVDLKKIKIFKDDVEKEIFVYGVQSKPMGIIKSEIIEGTSLRYTKYFSEQKMLTTDDMSEAEKYVFNRGKSMNSIIYNPLDEFEKRYRELHSNKTNLFLIMIFSHLKKPN